MEKVYRRQRVEGTRVWGIIHNGGYYLNPISVYEDGIVSCWKKCDLWQFEDELKQGWVVTAVPDGGTLSIFEVGSIAVKQAEWQHTQKSYYRYIKDTVQKLNPEMQNLYKTTQREMDKWGKYRVGFIADSTPFKLSKQMGYFCEDGKSCRIFQRQNGMLCLTSLTAYADGTFQLGTDTEHYCTLQDIEAMFADKTLTTQAKSEEWVLIEGVGRIQIEEYITDVSDKQKLAAIREMQKEIKDEPTAHEICIQAYHNYLEFPCEETKAELKQAYEAVPEFERCYLGDMDTRDSDYTRILYTNEKREV